MDCDVDLKGYVLGEATSAERGAVNAHVRACAACREELGRLQAAQSALMTLREEEPPRRIAFVSDQVFEPSWWRRLLAPHPAYGLAAAGVLAAAIVAHGAMTRPAAQMDPAVLEARVEQQVQQRLDDQVRAAVTKAVANVETREHERTAALLAATEKRFAEQRRADLIAFDENSEILYKRVARVLAQNDGPAPAVGVTR
jgi:anti-sigma factor RsiW